MIIISRFLWVLVSSLIFLLGLYLTIKYRGIQFRLFKMLKHLFNKNRINNFQVLMLTLAGKIGVGSISGVALAIYIGGAGTLFWIWVISFFSIPIIYAESYLGIKYREKNNYGEYNGGVAYYIKNGLNNYKFGLIYSVIIIVAYILGFTCIQSNTITKSLISVINIRPLFIGIILSIVTSLIVFGGIKKIINTTNKIVPIMTILYLVLGIIVIVKNIDSIPSIFNVIISSAFNYKAFGVSIVSTMIIGIQRGLFSSEAGIGTSSIAVSISQNNDMVSNGYIQMISVYITSFLICTITGIIVILSNYGIIRIVDPNGIEIAMYAFNYHFGNLGNILLIILIILFAFSTILSAYYYGEISLNYFNKKNINLLKSILIMIVLFGSIFSSTFIWIFIDINVAILAIINIYAIYKLRNNIKI